MLPGIGLQEMLLIVIVAITVVGPKDLPLMMRKFGRWVSRMRAMAHEFQTSFEDLARQAELDELRKEVEALRRDTARDLNSIKNAAHIEDPLPDYVASGMDRPSLEEQSAQPELPLDSPALEPSSAANDVMPEPAPQNAVEQR
jgi:sec-independent protein translocase protein TatB